MSPDRETPADVDESTRRDAERPWERWLSRPRAEATADAAGPPGPEPPPPSDDPRLMPARAPRDGPQGRPATPREAAPAQASLGLERVADPEPAPAREPPDPRGETRAASPSLRIWSVGDLTRLVGDLFRREERFRDLWVEGEVGQLSVSAAGHCYFALRDERVQVSCVMFSKERAASPFEPKTGLRIVVHGRLAVYEQQGTYQLYVDTVQPAGFGDLALRFEALKARLAAEGLFDPARRRPLPAFPHVVGVATSSHGAVFHDIRRVLARRWPLVRVVLSPCQVQGDLAPPTIVAALDRLARWRDPATGDPADLVILARGGGSLEDLWAFNDERVVRAVAASPIPVVSGVGHETDVTLVDFAADRRAPTPSAAAEVAVPSADEELRRLAILLERLAGGARRSLAGPRASLVAERRALARLHPATVILAERQRAGDLLERARRSARAGVDARRGALGRSGDRLPHLASARLAAARADLVAAAGELAALSPYATLDRGYAIARAADGRVLRDATAVSSGEGIDVRLARGSLGARVTDVREAR